MYFNPIGEESNEMLTTDGCCWCDGCEGCMGCTGCRGGSKIR